MNNPNHDLMRMNKIFIINNITIARVLAIILLKTLLLIHTITIADDTLPSNNILKSASELDYPPFAIVNKDGTAGGFSVELLKAAAEAAGFSVSFKVGPWHELKEELANRSLDVLPLVSHSPEREKIYDFTSPYLNLNGTIFVRDDNTEIKGLSDLEGKEVLVMRGDTAHEYVASKKLSECIIPTNTYEEAFKLLASGKHDAIVVQQIVGLQFIKKLQIKNVVPVYQKTLSTLKPIALKLEGFEQKFCFAVPKENKQLLSRLNEGLTVIYLNGTYNALYDKWFAPILPRPPISIFEISKRFFFILVPFLLVLTLLGAWYLKRLVIKKTLHLEQEIQRRKHIENKLEIANAKYIKAQETGKVGNWEYDLRTKVLYGSIEARRLFGFNGNSTSFTTETVQGCIVDIEPARQAWLDLINDGTSLNLESDIIPHNEAVRRTIHTLAELERDESGNPMIVRGVIQDITERRQAEEVREATVEILRLTNECRGVEELVHAATDFFQKQSGCEAVGIRLNEAEDYPYYETRGFSQEFVLAETRLCAHDNSNRIIRDMHGSPVLDCMCGNVIRGRFDPSKPYFTAKGSFWSNCTTDLLASSSETDRLTRTRNRCNGEGYESVALIPLCLGGERLGLLQLNDRRKGQFTLESINLWEWLADYLAVALAKFRADEELRKSEQRRSLALEAAQAGTWEWNLETNENIWSNELWKLYGLEPYSCKPSYEEWYKIIHPDDRQKTEQVIKEAVLKGAAFNTEWRVRPGDDGTERWLLSRGQPLMNMNDCVAGYLGTVFDITDRRHTEEEKKALQIQLQQAQKMEAIGTLAGGIAHDFNNILGAVIGYAEMARDACTSGTDIASDLDKVLEAGERATNLVKQILAFSRQTNMERVPLEPVHLVKETLKLLCPALPSTITIKQQLDAATRPILADPTQIHQIVMNLCTNAFHAMEQTGGTLKIILKNCELSPQDLTLQTGVQAGHFAVLSIGDTGPGINPAICDKIFEPYFTTKEVGKGTGMGLSIVHGIVTAMGGFVTCESELKKGTFFHVFFPAVEREVVPAIQPAKLVVSGKERVLFIDDEKILTEMGKIMLERLGYEVTVRTSSVEALTTFQNQPDHFDVVITDQTMPGITGIDLARKMLQIRPDIPIILCTGYSNLVNEEQAKAIGIKGFTMKPMSKTDIAQLLRKVLEA